MKTLGVEHRGLRVPKINSKYLDKKVSYVSTIKYALIKISQNKNAINFLESFVKKIFLKEMK